MDTGKIKIQSLSFYMAACVCFTAILIFHINTFLSSAKPSEIKLQSNINPNLANEASLVRLPNIGVSRARAIVNYRNKYSKDETVFETQQDLQKIKGVGPKTITQLEQYLTFEQYNNGTVGNK